MRFKRRAGDAAAGEKNYCASLLAFLLLCCMRKLWKALLPFFSLEFVQAPWRREWAQKHRLNKTGAMPLIQFSLGKEPIWRTPVFWDEFFDGFVEMYAPTSQNPDSSCSTIVHLLLTSYFDFFFVCFRSKRSSASLGRLAPSLSVLSQLLERIVLGVSVLLPQS